MNICRIQLIEKNVGYLEVKPNTEFPITFSVAEIRDISERSGTFSKEIEIAGTKNNNVLLNNYFDVNVLSGEFDVTKRQRCHVLGADDVPIIEDAYLQLVSVKKSQTNIGEDELVEYVVRITDSVVLFYNRINSRELTDLNFDDLNHEFSANTIINSFNHTVANGYKYIMPYSDTPDYQIQDFAPAIYAKLYLDRIFAAAGYTYSWPTLADKDFRFDKLLIPYNGDLYKKSNVILEANAVKFNQIADNLIFSETGGVLGNYIGVVEKAVDNVNEVQDVGGIFDGTTGIYNNPYVVTTTSPLVVRVSGLASMLLQNNGSFDIRMCRRNQGAAVTPQPLCKVKYTAQLVAYKVSDGSVLNTLNLMEGTVDETFVIAGTPTSTPTSYNLFAPSNIDGFMEINNIGNEAIAFEVRLIPTDYYASGSVSNECVYKRTNFAGLQTNNPRIKLNLSSLVVSIIPPNALTYLDTVSVSEFIPKKVKQSDFLKSIFTMFNLYAEVDRENPRNIVITPRDQYYDNGKEVDWSKKLSKKKEHTVTFLPDVTKKVQHLTYKEDKDTFNTVYQDSVKQVYGEVKYYFESEWVKGVDKKELIFSPTPTTLTSWGAYLPTIDKASPKNNIRILYDDGIKTSSVQISIQNFFQNFTVSLVYPQILHFDDPVYPNFDLNFGQCRYYFYNTLNTDNITANNLYNNNWRRTLSQLNTGKMLTAYFDLDVYDIYKMRMSDKIYVKNAWWYINKISDYKANTKEETKVELLSAEDDLILVDFQKGGEGGGIIEGGEGPKLLRSNVSDNGSYNTIESTVYEASIIGDGNYVSANSVVNGSQNKVMSEAVINGNRNTVDAGLYGVVVNGNDIVADKSDTTYENNLQVTKALNDVPIEKVLAGATSIGVYETDAIIIDTIALARPPEGEINLVLPSLPYTSTVTVKDISEREGDINIIITAGGPLIDGDVDYKITTKGGKAVFVSDGTNWFTI